MSNSIPFATLQHRRAQLFHSIGRTLMLLSLLCYLGLYPALAQSEGSTSESRSDEAAIVQELDAYWSALSEAVAEGDFEGYAALHHPDAVLVVGRSQRSMPIAEALAGWEQGFRDTAAGKQGASVEFRFGQRLVSPRTAHETGIFRYTSTDESGTTVTSTLHFEALLVKQADGWKTLMEYQQDFASDEDWASLADS